MTRFALFFLPAVMFAQLERTSPLGMKFYAQPDTKGVVAAAEKASAADPTNIELLLKLGVAQVSVRQYREAVATYTRGLSIDPNNVVFLLERGHRLLGLREFKKACADLTAAEKLNQKQPDVYYHLGLSHYFLREFSEAADAFKQAVIMAPTLDSRINSTNWYYASLRRAKRDEEAATALAAITPDMKNNEPHTFFYLSLVRLFQGKMTPAEAVPPQPTDPADTEAELRFDTVAYGTGNWYLYNGNPVKAREYFKKVVKGHVWMTWGFIGAENELTRK
jgi:tetratricopeptide (TPR) repeat protein